MHTENRWLPWQEAGAGRKGEMGKEDGNQIFGGQHIVGHSEVEIQRCPHETYNIIN